MRVRIPSERSFPLSVTYKEIYMLDLLDRPTELLTLIESTNEWCTDTCDTSGCSNTCGEIKNHRGPHKCYLH